jgi:hypothetical protein
VNTQEFQNTVDSLILLYRERETLAQEVTRLRQALARIRNSSLPNEEPVSREIASAAVEVELSQSQAGMGELLRYRRALEIIRDESLSEEAVKAIAEFALVGVI